MNKRILLAGLTDCNLQNIKKELTEYFDVVESDDMEDALLVLLKQYRLVKMVLLSMDLFCKDNYHFINELNRNIVLKHIPVICIGPVYESLSEHNLAYYDALDHGALSFFTQPFDFPIFRKQISNWIKLKEITQIGKLSTQNDATVNYENSLSSGTFWNPKSLDHIIMQTSLGAVCLLECIQERITIVKTNDDFLKEIMGSVTVDVDVEHFFERYLDRDNKWTLRNTLEQTIENREVKAKCELKLRDMSPQLPLIHLQMSMRLIEKVNERALVYCVLENDTEKYNLLGREADMVSQMQVIIQNFNCGITVAYDDFGSIRYDYSNAQFYAIFGYTKEEFEEEEIDILRDLILPEYFFEVKTALNTARVQMKPVVIVFQARKKDGVIIWVKIRCSVHYMRARQRTAFIAMYEDITNMKASEDRIHQLNDKLANSEVYFQLDITNKLVEAYHSIYEPDKSNLLSLNSNYKELLLSPIYDKDKDNTWSILSYENLMESYYAGNTKLSVEYRRLMPDGGTRWFAVTAVIVSGGEDEVINAFIYAHDIDVKMKTRIAKDKIMDTDVSDISIINIANGMCRNIKIYDSDVAKSNTVNKYEDNVNRFISQEVAREDQERCREFFHLKHLIPAVKKAGSVSISFQITTKAGMNVRKNGTVTYLDNTHEDLLLIGRDITELFEKEKEQQMALKHAVELADIANQAKSDFLARMSHDMRTPLNAIIGMTRIAMDENQSEKMEEYLKSVDVSSHFLLTLINDSLDLSKIESGKMELHREAFPLEEFMIGINTVIKPLMRAKNIQFDINLQKQINRIAVDKMRFNQIFYNLLSNAAKYTPEGGRVEFFSEPIAPKGDKVGMRFHVRDNGIGMSKEYQKILFEPFTQEYHAMQDEQRGTGLGLSIVKQIVDLAEGNITVISEPNMGTEFIVDLYAYKLDSLDELPDKPVYDIEKLHGKHILLVDDMAINAVIVQKMLQTKGCTVITATNGQEGLAAFETSEVGYYDIILTDLRMPVMDGFEEAKRIRMLNRKDASTIPIIAATADAYDDIKIKILESGMNERLVKPIEADFLFEAIIRLTENNGNQ